MFCSECGAKLEGSAAFCNMCGAKAIAPVKEASSPSVVKAGSRLSEKKRKIIFAVCIICIVTVISAGNLLSAFSTNKVSTGSQSTAVKSAPQPAQQFMPGTLAISRSTAAKSKPQARAARRFTPIATAPADTEPAQLSKD